MSNFTKDNIGKPMATLFVEYKDSGKKDANGRAVLVKQEEVINIANIQSRLGNSFRITGINNPNEARQLSLLLRAGALIAPIQIVEERTIGPTLGMQNIKQGLEACLTGLAVSILFMILFYKKFGLIATSALIANFGTDCWHYVAVAGGNAEYAGDCGDRLNPCRRRRCERPDQRTYQRRVE